MALNRDKLKLAQEELDRVVGPDRLPNIGDRAYLPYVEAVIKETMRWHPALPLSEFSETSKLSFPWAYAPARYCTLHCQG